jgi:peptidoglycan/LPS O-acetylase OafA/YrhL
MKRFYSIEGLRGWLAWIVVFSHLVQTSDVYADGLGPAALRAGQVAVLVFIIISGFVITHLVTERPEPYSRYILQRFMRIFPLFVVTCIMGFYASDMRAVTLSHVAWADTPSFADRLAWFVDVARSDHDFFWAHALAHLTMLHGAVSSRILPFAPLAFNPPAWSISLEWQFYLLAPLAIMLIRRKRTFIWLALAVATIECLYQLGLFGTFETPSLLPAAAGYFVLGIVSRLLYPRLVGSLRYSAATLPLFAVLLPLGWDAVPILVWAVVMFGLLIDRSDASASLFISGYRKALESRFATYCGSRSYSVYLSHYPIIGVCHALWIAIFPMAQKVSTLVGVSAMTIPITFVVAEVFYRGIERPGIALGSRLARWNKAAVAYQRQTISSEYP